MRLFTVDEANELLPELKRDLHRLQTMLDQCEEQAMELQRRKNTLASYSAGEEGMDPFFEVEGRLDFMRMEVQMLAGNFERKGVLLKMVQPGLIDFPAVVDGEEALICWQEGEERASHYHGWHDGFQGRKPLPGD